jgi:FkbM family methyltransferase
VPRSQTGAIKFCEWLLVIGSRSLLSPITRVDRANGTSVRRQLRDSLVGFAVRLSPQIRLWALNHLRRPILWALFRLENSGLTVSYVGPSYCRYRMQVLWQSSTEMALGTYELCVADVLRRELRLGDFCIDVGAHIGYHALLMSKLVGPQGMVLAFEPFLQTFHFLEANARLNAMSNLKLENIAIAERCETLRLAFPLDEELSMSPSVSAYATNRPQEIAEVPAISLDSYLRQLGKMPSLIQIDVEGAEMSVLRGAEAILRSFHPKLILEIHDWRTRRKDEVYGFLSSLGYKGQVIGQRGNEGFVLFSASKQ